MPTGIFQAIRDVVTIARLLPLTLVICFSASCSRDNRQADMKQCIADVQKDASEGNIADLLRTDTGGVLNHDKNPDRLGARAA